MTTIWTFPIELLASLVAYCIGLEKRAHYGFRMIGVVIFSGMLVLFSQVLVARYMDANGTIETISVTVTGNISMLLILFSLVTVPAVVLYRLKLKEAVYCSLCAYLSEHMAYCIRILVNYCYAVMICKKTYGDAAIADTRMPLYFIIHIGVYVISYYAFSRKMIKNQHYSTTAVQSVGLMIMVAFLVIGMSVMASTYHFEPIHAIYALFACVLVLYSQVKQQKKVNLEKELLLQQQMWVKHKAQYEMSKDTIDIINTKCHDLKHQIAALLTMKDIDDRSRAIDSLQESVMIYDSMVKTGNEILDTVLTEKGLICQQKKIILSCIADGKLLNFMDPVDLYTLFGNAIDNAIEGTQEVSEDLRGISLHLQQKAGMILLQVENPYIGKIQLQDGMPMTSKQDKFYHGFGVKSMIQIAEKYNGIVKIETDHQMFVLRIMIPMASV